MGLSPRARASRSGFHQSLIGLYFLLAGEKSRNTQRALRVRHSSTGTLAFLTPKKGYRYVTPKNRHQYPQVSALDVRAGFPGPIFEFEQTSVSRSIPWILIAPTSVATALDGTLPRASLREYRAKREPQRANVGMERKWSGTIQTAGRPRNSGVQALENQFQRTGVPPQCLSSHRNSGLRRSPGPKSAGIWGLRSLGQNGTLPDHGSPARLPHLAWRPCRQGDEPLRDNLVIENLPLRQQIAALKKDRPQPSRAILRIRRRTSGTIRGRPGRFPCLEIFTQ